MPPLNAITVPTFARADEYAGVWAIEPTAGEALWRQAANIDLAAHVALTQAAPRPSDSTLERIQTADGQEVALIRLQGVLMKQRSSLGSSTSTIQARRDVRAATSDPNIKAILIAVDSPGGTVAGTEALANDVRNAGKVKPVFGQIEDLGASAAYEVLSQCLKVFASTRSTLVGSIGTMMTVIDSSQAAAAEGVKVHVFATGPVKGAGTPGTELTDDQKAYFRKIVASAQTVFDDAVKSGRKMTDAQLALVRTGAVFGADEAQALGLIDGIQSLDATLSQLLNQPGGPQGSRLGRQSGPLPGVLQMTPFETYCQARDFDATNLTDKQRAALQADFEASQKTPPVAKPITAAGSDGASLMGDLERRQNEHAIHLADLHAVCQENGNPRVEFNGVTQTAYQHAVKNKLSIEDARRLCALGKMRDTRPANAGINPGVSIADRDLVLQAAVEQTLRIEGHEKQFSDQILQAAHTHYRGGISLQQLILEAAFANGYQGKMTAVKYDLKNVLMAAFSTVSLPGILGNTANKSLLKSFMNVEQAWRMITKVRPVNDFKTVTSYRMTGDETFEIVGPGGELKHATASEESFTNAADTYGKLFSITRKDIVNDDLGALAEKPRRIGRGAALKVNDVFWTAFTTNTSFFVDPSQNYYKGADAVLAAAGLAKVLAKFRNKIDPDSKPLSIEPKILLVPPALEVTALELMTSSNFNTGGSSSTDKVPQRNIWANKFSIVVSTYLENASYGNSTVIWYLLADPEDIPVIETCFLNGNESPIVESADADFSTLGIQMRGYYDFGVSRQDARGGVKSKGAA